MGTLRWQVIAERVSAPAAVATGERRLTLFARGSRYGWIRTSL